MTPANNPEQAASPGDRSGRWIQLTIIIQILSFFLYPAFICGCHYHAEAIPAGAVPIVWGFYAFLCYRTKRERWIGYINGALSIFWLFFSWESNLQFLFR